MMNRETFCRAMARRGYTVSNVGLMTILESVEPNGSTYTAIWFFNADGSRNENCRPSWHLSRPRSN